MSTTDFSTMSADEIKALLAQRRAEINSIQKVAKEKGVAIPSEHKFPKTIAALRQATRSFSKAERNFNEAQAAFNEARTKRDEALEAHLTSTGATALDAETQQMLDQLYEESKQRLPGVKKADPNAEPTPVEAPAE